MTSFDTQSGLYLPRRQLVPHQQLGSQQVVLAQHRLSGEPGWVDAVAQIDTDAGDSTDSGLALAQVIVANQGGTVTKARIYSNVGGGGNGKIKVYDVSWAELGSTSGYFTDFIDDYIEFTLDAGGFSCTNGQELRICLIAESSAAVLRYKTGEPANSSYYSFGYTYTGGLPSTFVPDGGLTRKYAFGLYIVP